MAISVQSMEDFYQISFFHHTIKTIVTSNPTEVVNWINSIESIHLHHLCELVVGLDVEWRPYFDDRFPNPVSVLQLCVGHHCLVFQILHATEIPQALFDFLRNWNYTFVGVGVSDDAQRLYTDYKLEVSKTIDLRSVASIRSSEEKYRRAGLTVLAKAALSLDYNKLKRITLSDWSEPNLSIEQIAYAAIDAFLSFEIGRSLNASQFCR
ncbi:unnamed protein product [Amaranthus hypochondriacus]